jgi:hypothetical protein
MEAGSIQMNRAYYFAVFLIHKTVEEPVFHVICELGYDMPDQNILPTSQVTNLSLLITVSEHQRACRALPVFLTTRVGLVAPSDLISHHDIFSTWL